MTVTTPASALLDMFIQSAMCHPTWTTEEAVSYAVNDEFIDPTELVTLTRHLGMSLDAIWDAAKETAWVLVANARAITSSG